MLKISIGLSILLFVPLGVAALADENISLHFDNVPIEQVIGSLAEAKKLNLVVAPNIDRMITVHLTEVSWSNALEVLKELAEISIREKDNILIISPRPQITALSDPFLSRHSAQFDTLPTKTFELRFIDAIETEKKLLALSNGGLSALGKVSADAKQQRITVWDDEESLRRISEWLFSQDIAQPQIEIAAQMISISQENLRELGISWHTAPLSTLQDPLATTHQFSTSFNVATPALTASVGLSGSNSQLLFLELSALEHENQIEIIASPRLITSQGSTASIKQGTEIPYQTVSGKNENPVIAFKEAVLGMQVTAEQIGTQQIKLRLHLSQNFPGKILQGDGQGPPSIDKQEISTEVVISDGQTLALGGIFQQHQQKGTVGIPWLSQIPLLGVLFRHHTDQQQRRELVIFITPRLLHLRNTPKIPLDEGSPLTSRAN